MQPRARAWLLERSRRGRPRASPSPWRVSQRCVSDAPPGLQGLGFRGCLIGCGNAVCGTSQHETAHDFPFESCTRLWRCVQAGCTGCLLGRVMHACEARATGSFTPLSCLCVPNAFGRVHRTCHAGFSGGAPPPCVSHQPSCAPSAPPPAPPWPPAPPHAASQVTFWSGGGGHVSEAWSGGAALMHRRPNRSNNNRGLGLINKIILNLCIK